MLIGIRLLPDAGLPSWLLILLAAAVVSAGPAQAQSGERIRDSAAVATVISDAETMTDWGREAELTDDCKQGKHAVAWKIPATGVPVALTFNLRDKRDAVAHGKTLRFWYKFDGRGVTDFRLKIVAHPLAGGWQAAYQLPVPIPGQWQQARVPLQQFDDQWGDKPDARSGTLMFRVESAKDADARLLIDDVRVIPMPPGSPVNEGEKKLAQPVKPLIDASKPMNLPDHPRLMLSAGDVPVIKERIAKSPWAKAYADGLRRRCEDLLKGSVELPPRGSQWWHYYACPKDGSRLKTESPTRHVCPTCSKVYTGYPYDDVVLAGDHSRLANGVRDLGLEYQLTGEKRYAARAREILLAYADRYLKYPLHTVKNEPKVGGGRVSPQTLDESCWLIPMAQGADAIWDTLSPADIETLKTKLFYPAAVDVIGKHQMGIHNIQCWKNSAVGLVGLLFGDAALVADAIDSEHGYQAQMAQGVGPDGMWYEGAWGYHFYTLDAVHPLTEAAHHCGINLYGEQYKRMFTAPLDLAMPDGKLPAFNDSGTATAIGNANYEIALARYKDARLAAPLADRPRRSLQVFLCGAGELPASPPTSQPSRNLPESGYAVLTAGSGKDATWLCMKYGPHGGGHGHPDKNSFVLYAGGEVLAGDPGTASYGVPIQAGWYRTTLAHNTLVVDETSQHQARGASLDFRTGEGWSASLTDAGYAYAGISFRRAAFLIGKDTVAFLDLVSDDDRTSRTLDLACHLSGSWAAVPPGDPASPPDKPGYSYLRDLRAAKREDGLTVAVKSPVGHPVHIAFAASPGAPTTYWTATGVGANVEDRVPAVIARRQAAAAAFAWVIGINPAGVAPAVSLVPVTTQEGGTPVPSHDAAAMLIKSEGGTYLVIANPASRAIRVGAWAGADKLAVAKQ